MQYRQPRLMRYALSMAIAAALAPAAAFAQDASAPAAAGQAQPAPQEGTTLDTLGVSGRGSGRGREENC